MECSICFESINQETGKAELSCMHAFHIACLSRWFSKNSSCPCCRHEASSTETMTGLYDSESDSDDSESDSDDSSIIVPLTMAQLEHMAAKERARHLFRKLKFFNPIVEVELYSVKFIQSWYRTYKIRCDYKEIQRLRMVKKTLLMQLRIINAELGFSLRDEESAITAFKQRYLYNYRQVC